jgi:hypothetical protein
MAILAKGDHVYSVTREQHGVIVYLGATIARVKWDADGSTTATFVSALRQTVDVASIAKIRVV